MKRSLSVILTISLIMLGMQGCKKNESSSTISSGKDIQVSESSSSQDMDDTKENSDKEVVFDKEDSTDTQSKEASSEKTEIGTPLADVRVRQALAYAIDMNAIVETLFDGKAEVAKSFTSPGEWLNVDVKGYEYDPEKAKELLKEADWPSDYTLDVVYYYGDQQTVDLMTIIGQYWKEVGVNAKFRKLEGDLASQLWVAPEDKVNGPSAVKWDLAYAAVAALSESEFYNRFASNAPNNSSVPKQNGLDELIIESNSTMDKDEQIKAFGKIQKFVYDNALALPLYHQVCFIYKSKDLDTAGSKFGNDQFSYEKNILDWTTKRSDKTLYTNGGPQEFYWYPMINPGLMLYQELLFDRLINADENLNPTDGMLAKEYSVSEDSKTINFTLRDNLKWHDGEALTVDDVKFTLELMLKTPSTNAVASEVMEAIVGADDFKSGKADLLEGVAVNGNEISIKFSRVSANALQVLSQWPILPKHLLENVNPAKLQQDEFWQKPIGSGPFKVKETVLNNYAILTRFDGYYKKGKGNIEKIYMNASGENDANLVKNIEAGRIDYAWSKSTEDAKAIEKVANYEVIPANVRYTRCFYINQFPHEANVK